VQSSDPIGLGLQLFQAEQRSSREEARQRWALQRANGLDAVLQEEQDDPIAIAIAQRQEQQGA
jgi:hypothetical protein